MLSCNWLYFKELVKYHSLLVMWKLVHLDLPRHLRTKIEVDPDRLIQTTKGRIKTSLTSFRWRTVLDWNCLESDLRHEDNLGIFKRSLKKFLIEQRLPDIPRPATVPD